MLSVMGITAGQTVAAMRRNPIQQLSDLVGMYAYLMALGGLRYWPTVRRAAIEEQSLDGASAQRAEGSLPGTSPSEFEPEREELPVA